jgi:CheY-like chemotaxis protein
MPSAFERALRQALNHLYEPSLLRRSPLAKLLALEKTPNTAEALRSALEREIAAMEPPPGTQLTCKSQLHYQVLFYRYIQQLTQLAVANQLGVSIRQLRREQDSAIQALSSALRSRFALPNQNSVLEQTLLAMDPSAPEHGGMEQELAWLSDSLTDQLSDVATVIQEALELTEPLSHKHNVRILLEAHGNIPPAAASPVVLKQIVINLLTTAIHHAANGSICLTPSICRSGVRIRVAVSENTSMPSTHAEGDAAAMQMAHRLAQLFRGELALGGKDEPFEVSLTLPSASKITVLAIEDNADTLQLWQRYLQGSSFRMVEVSNPHQALATAIQCQPRAIILDVMMPGIDGWQLLGQLRNHPATHSIPVIVCTVLPQKELALALGASDFISKPVSRRHFRRVLERQIAPAMSG